MSYDPQDFKVEWRDIGAGCLLYAVALLGLLVLGSAKPAAREDGTQAAYGIERSASAYCSRQACPPEHGS
jgi:hypothetical protein